MTPLAEVPPRFMPREFGIREHIRSDICSLLGLAQITIQ
jgi:hypothetical protein